MKVIDLLNKIANGEEIRFRLLCDDDVFKLTKGCILYNETQREKVQWWIDEDWLNEEVEIIEEDKKIEKIDVLCLAPMIQSKKTLGKQVEESNLILCRKINEIIEYINKENK